MDFGDPDWYRVHDENWGHKEGHFLPLPVLRLVISSVLAGFSSEAQAPNKKALIRALFFRL